MKLNKKIYCFGEVLLRMEKPMHQDVTSFDFYVGGAAYNTAVNLSGLGVKSSMLTILPKNFVGDISLKNMNANNVSSDLVEFFQGEHGMYFLESGSIDIGSNVIYNRSSSVFNKKIEVLKNSDFGSKNDIFHFSGISLLLSQKCFETTLFLAKKIKSKGLIISFDFNYRSKLASYSVAKKRFEKLLEISDIVFATKRDFVKIFKYDEKNKEEEIYKEVFKKYNLKYLFHTKRGKNGRLDTLQSFLYTTLESYCSEVEIFNMYERIGGGDAFVSGVLYSLIKNKKGKELINWANKFAVYKQSVGKGDNIFVAENTINDYIKNNNKIRR